MKRISLILGICVLISLTGCSSSYMATLKRTYEKGGYEAGMDYFRSVMHEASLEEYEEMHTYIRSKLEYTETDNNIIEEDGYGSIALEEDYTDKLEIVASDWGDGKIEMTVKNTGDKTVTYFKYDIFFKDFDGKIVDSDWSNSSKTILPDAQAEVSTYIDKPDGLVYPEIKITEVKTK